MTPRDLRNFVLGLALFLVIAFSIHAARAAEGNLQLHIASEHSGGCETCNEANWGIGYLGSGPGTRLVAGYYTNSWFRDSFYVGGNWRLFGSNAISVSIVGVTGYRGTSETVDEYLIAGEFMPLPLAHVNLGPALKRMQLWPGKASVTPAITYAPTQDGGVYLFSLNHRF